MPYRVNLFSSVAFKQNVANVDPMREHSRMTLKGKTDACVVLDNQANACARS